MSTVIGALTAIITADSTKLKIGLKDAEQSLEGSTGRMRGTLKAFGVAAAAAFAAAATVAVTKFTKSVIEAGVQMESLTKSMTAAVGSAQASAAAMALLRTESEKLGLYLPTQVKGFQQLAAAARGTVLQGQDTVDIFLAISEASTALQLSSEETGGAIRALTQVISKGKVQAEELRGQLGERVPGAFQMAAVAMKMTTEELSKALELGEVYAEDFIPKFAKALRERYANSWQESAKSTQAAINRLKTAWVEFRVAVFESGLGDLFKKIIQGLTYVLKNWERAWKFMHRIFIEFIFDPLGQAWIVLREEFNLMMSLITGSFEAGVKLIVEMLAGMIQTFADMTAGISFLGELNRNLQMSADNAKAAADGMKGFGDIIGENINTRQQALDQHAEIIDGMIKENTMYAALTENAISYAEAVGTVNNQRALELELAKEQAMHNQMMIEQGEALLALKEADRVAAEKMAIMEEQRKSDEFGKDQMAYTQDLQEADRKVTEEAVKNEKTKEKVRKEGAKKMVQNAKYALKVFGENNRTAFAAFKAISIAETLANTYKAAMGAYSSQASIPVYGPALGVAAAAAAVAAGAAQVSQIASLSPAGGGGGSATPAGLSSGGGGAAAVGTFPADPTTGLPDLQAGTGGAQGPQTIIDMREIRVDSEERIAQIANQLKDLFEEKDIVGQTTVRA